MAAKATRPMKRRSLRDIFDEKAETRVWESVGEFIKFKGGLSVTSDSGAISGKNNKKWNYIICDKGEVWWKIFLF